MKANQGSHCHPCLNQHSHQAKCTKHFFVTAFRRSTGANIFRIFSENDDHTEKRTWKFDLVKAPGASFLSLSLSLFLGSKGCSHVFENSNAVTKQKRSTRIAF